MPIGIRVPDPSDPGTVDFAVRAEELGYDSVWAAELWGGEAFVTLTNIANATERVNLGTAIVNVFSRSPAVLSMAVTSLDSSIDRTMTLGLGVSTPKSIEDLHGMAFERPIRRTHEAVELVKAFTSGDGRVDYDGEVFSTADFPALSADVPVYNAALGEANCRATGRVCDGWIPHMVPWDELGSRFEIIASAARDAGRDPSAISVTPYVPTAVSEDRESARAAMRGHIAYYTGSGEGYRNAVALGYPEEAERIFEAWRAGDRGDAREAVTDEMITAFGIAGTPAEAQEQLDALMADTPIDEPLIVTPAGLDEAYIDLTLETLAPNT